MTHTDVEDQGQRSVGNGQTDGGDRIASRANVVGNKLGSDDLSLK